MMSDKFLLFAVIALTVVMAGSVITFSFTTGSAGTLLASVFPVTGINQWQSVFLTNNQVYFGHLENYSNDYVVLKDIFYLSVAEPLQIGSPPKPSQPTINLVKLGSELHGPQDVMYIPKDKIMFWENLKGDSQVVQAIGNFLSQKK